MVLASSIPSSIRQSNPGGNFLFNKRLSQNEKEYKEGMTKLGKNKKSVNKQALKYSPLTKKRSPTASAEDKESRRYIDDKDTTDFVRDDN